MQLIAQLVIVDALGVRQQAVQRIVARPPFGQLARLLVADTGTASGYLVALVATTANRCEHSLLDEHDAPLFTPRTGGGPHTGYCPIGEGCDPLVQWLQKALREWAPVKPGYWGTPVNDICKCLAKIGQTYKKDEIVALAKELKAAKDTHASALEGLELIINLEKK